MDCEFLRTISFLGELSEEELQAFAALFDLKEIAPGQKIVEEGKVINSFHIVCKGTVHVRRTVQKKEMLLGRICAGGFFGEINLFDPGVATASIYAMDKAKIASTDYETLRGFMEANTNAGYRIVAGLMAEVCRRLRLTNQRFVNSVYWASEQVPK
ncbi:MAG TPA: cyclic nucleotide-binding domain-containing protein [Chthoniobacteraceae bacterium]|nr:cyclic nucleotide-binding domain-containing protein [Chthoniobacteraceae bacterium]